jgi:oxygen-independent coproporphyrinogen-3 oxidase
MMSTGLYIHLPFCRAQCTYCPFAVSTDLSLEAAYTDALVAEIESAADLGLIGTLFLGGGTPSRSPIASLRRVLDAVRRQSLVDPAAEVSIEANPEDVTPLALEGWQSLGVTRISIGVQSLHDDELYPLGRGHRSSVAREAVSLAVASGLRTSADLILGLPHQSEEGFEETLEAMLTAGVGHLSLYMLDLEEGTALHRQVDEGRATVPPDEQTARSYSRAVERLEQRGFAQYEISNFARPGEVCRHNVAYWQRMPYRGFGIGAHSYDGLRRWANCRSIGQYIEAMAEGRSATDFSETLGPIEQREEAIFLGLRQSSGLDYRELIALCGEKGAEWAFRGLQGGWLKERGGRVAFTSEGFLFSTEYIAQLF